MTISHTLALQMVIHNSSFCRLITYWLQPYKCNKKWVVSLKPLPHNGSGSHMDGDEACHVCKRKLNDFDRYSFCCLACKVINAKNIIKQTSLVRTHIRTCTSRCAHTKWLKSEQFLRFFNTYSFCLDQIFRFKHSMKGANLL